MSSDFPQRKRIRITKYDYAQNGAYFVTICSCERKMMFGVVGATSGRPQLSDIGVIIDNEIQRISGIYDNVMIDKYVVMPNHIHMIILLQANGRPKAAPTISRIVAQFKGAITKKVGHQVWQKSFHEHIIRSEQDYLETWDYIDTNPAKWQEDKYYL